MNELIADITKEIKLTRARVSYIRSFTRRGNLLKYIKKLANDYNEESFLDFYLKNQEKIEKIILEDSDNFLSLNYDKKYSSEDISSLLYNFLMNPKIIHNNFYTSSASAILSDNPVELKQELFSFPKVSRNGNTNIPTNNKLKQRQRSVAIFENVGSNNYLFKGYFKFNKSDDLYLYFEKYQDGEQIAFKTLEERFEKTATQTITPQILTQLIEQKAELPAKQQDLPEKLISEDQNEEKNRQKDSKSSNIYSALFIEYKVELAFFLILNSYLRLKLLDAKKHCELTGIINQNYLSAVYIKNWKFCNNKEKQDLDNLLLLNKYHAYLFSKGLIAFDNAGKVIYSSRFLGEKSQSYLSLKFVDHQKEYLNWHRIHTFIY